MKGVSKVFYRYECQTPDGTRMGILTAIDDIFTFAHTEDEATTKIFLYGWPFEKYLEAPTCTMSDTISYFTEKGNRKLNKAIRNLRNAIESEGFATYRITLPSIDEDMILYQDEYQIVLLRG